MIYNHGIIIILISSTENYVIMIMWSQQHDNDYEVFSDKYVTVIVYRQTEFL